MIHSMTDWIMELLRSHGAVSVFIGVIIESVIVPIPSPLIIMGAGSILIDPYLSAVQAAVPILYKIVLPGAAASTLGAYIAYGICYWGGKPVVDRFGKFLGFSWVDVEAMDQRIAGRKTGLIIFLLRALPIVPLSLISAAAGSIRLPLGSFTLWTFLGSVPRCLFLGYLGWLMRESYVAIAKDLNFIEGLISGTIVLSALGLVIWLRSRMKRSS